MTVRNANIEPVARTITDGICRRAEATNPSGMTEADIRAWVDSHWQCAAAELSAALLDDGGAPRAGWSLEKSVEAWHDWMRSR